MSEVNAPAPQTAPTTNSEASTTNQLQNSAPDLQNMTGEQAVAYVEAQKAAALQAKGKPGPTTIKEAAAEAKRKLKIDDQEIDEDEVIKTYRDRKGHQQAANKILQEGKLLRKQAEEFIQMMRDPEKVFEVIKKLGHDPRTLAEKRLVAELEEEMLDPRDRELKETKNKLKAIEDMEKKQKEEVEQQRIQVLKEKFAKDYTEQFTAALSEVSVPATKGTVAEMAKYIARAAEMKFKMTAQEAAQLVREDMIQAQQKLIGDSDGEVLIKLLGEDVANKVRKWDTSRLKNPEPPKTTKLDQGPPRERKAPHKRMSSKEWREFNRGGR